MKQLKTDVLVVGAGPAGLTLSALLAREGVQALTLSKYGGTADSPRAHITNQRTVEVFRDLGIEEKVMARTLPQHLMGKQVVATSFTGREISRMDSWGTGKRQGDYDAASPCKMCNAPQHVLEPILLERARDFGADIRFNQEVVAVSQAADFATARVRDRRTGKEYEVCARYIVGCDGAQTVVGKDFDFGGSGSYGEAITVWIEADLTEYTAYRSGALFMVTCPGSDTVISIWTCVEPWTEWSTIFIAHGMAESERSEDAIIARVREAIGDPSIPVKIKKISGWQFHHTFANHYRDGRLFIAGDAAHRHPPANGLGSCTSIQDSYNLAWKLALVCRSRAAEALLDSYNDERQPVGQQVVERANLSAMEMAGWHQVLGIFPGLSAEEGHAIIDKLHGPEGEEQRKRLIEQHDVWNYQFNCHGVEMGQRYEHGALVSDGTPFPEYERDSLLHYHPTTHPGAPIPHIWIEQNKKDISTLDLCAYNRFTLLVGADGDAWSEAALEATRELGVSVRPVVVDLGQANNDFNGDWMKSREVSASGCLLVRPDRIVAWRSAGAVDSPTETLANVMREVLSVDVAATISV